MAASGPSAANVSHSAQATGVLTRTVIKSPVVRWILHARLRQKAYNDVVFVGETFIHVKHVGHRGHLEHITSKTDLDARIRAAKTFSTDVDPVKTEDDLVEGSERSTPQHFLVLTLDTHDVLFLYLTEGSDGTPRFVQQECPLPIFENLLYQPGQHLAVDPYSRAIAVTANEREVMLYSAKKGDQIGHELRSGDPDWCPVSSHRPIQVAGIIQHMEFLYPRSGDSEHVILLLIVIDEQLTKAIWIDWYHSSGLHHPLQIHPPQPIDTARTVSTLLIPLLDAAFMLISGRDVKLWTDLLSGSINSHELPPLDAQPIYEGNSPRQPVWASWCRPVRNTRAQQEQDHLYLVREDGELFYAKIAEKRIASCSAGHFQCHVGTAFASLGGPRDPDILAVVGDMSTGCVVSIGHWPGQVDNSDATETMQMDLVETIPNWATATDMTWVPTRHSLSMSSRSLPSRPNLLVTSGREPYGTITELRKGLEARLSACLEIECLQNAIDVWAVPLVAKDVVLIFMSSPISTRIISVNGGFDVKEHDNEDCSALDFDDKTLAVGAISDSPDCCVIQVTPRRITRTPSLESNWEDTVRRERDAGDTILVSAIKHGVVVTAERRGNGYSVCCTSFAASTGRDSSGRNGAGSNDEAITQLSSEPTALAVASLQESLVAVVSLADGRLCFYRFGHKFTIKALHELTLPLLDSERSSCDHLVVLEGPNTSSKLVLAGLRDGRVHCIKLDVNTEDETAIKDSHTFEFGYSGVKLTGLPHMPGSAFATSGADTCILTWDGVSARTLEINSIWFSDKAHPERAQDPVAAITQMPTAEYMESPEMAEALIFMSGNEFIFASLEPRPSVVLRQLAVTGTPTRLLYAEHQRCLIVTSIKTKIRSISTPAGRPEKRRQIWPVVDFIPTRSSHPSHSHDLQPGERVYALLEWSYRGNEDKTYSFVIVGGSYVRHNRSTGGKSRLLQPVFDGWEVVDVKENYERKFDAPVYALALYDELTYAACIGDRVVLFRYSIETRKWNEACEPFKLASPGISVTIESQLIYVSTLEDSLVTLRLAEQVEEGESLSALIPVAEGPEAQALLSHLIVHTDSKGSAHRHQQDIALVSTKERSLVGFTSPLASITSASHSTGTTILFEAHLPHSLTRLRQVPTRPRWKLDLPPGVIADSIVGCAPDGALVGMALLDEKLWRRLSWLQRLCEWDDDISPRAHHSPAYSADEENAYGQDERGLPIGLSSHGDDDLRRDAGTQEVTLWTSVRRVVDKHIDGDILARILEKGGGASLRFIIEKAARRKDRIGVWVSAHLHDELEAVDETIDILKRLLDCWM